MELSQQERNPEGEGNLININISGQQFLITADTLKKYPETKLGKLAIEQSTLKSYFFESDVDTFKEVLKFYQKGKLHRPKNICLLDFCENLEYWKVDLSYLSECCSEDLKDEQEMEKQFHFFNNKFQMTNKNAQSCSEWQYKVWSFLTDPHGSEKTWKLGAKVWMVSYLLITCMSGLMLAAATQPYSKSNNSYLADNRSSLRTKPPANETEETGLMETCRFVRKWRPSQYSTPVSASTTMNLVFLVFYAVEIWVRFSLCPNKRLFLRSVNGLDMLISICECITSCFQTYVNFNFSALTEQSGERTYCKVARAVEQGLIVLSQLRFIRLLGYATVYR